MPNTPPNNVSPTDTTSNLHYRQLRPQRTPLYIPAALRPTQLPAARDIPGHPRPPDTPPFSQGNSFDSAKLHGNLGNSSVSFDGLREHANQLERELYRSAEIEEAIDIVTGPPTKAHWKPDQSATGCNVCHVPFKWWFRRHHCRHCGHLVCENHSRATVPLDQNARFHSQGERSKACDPCYEEWRLVRKWRHSRASSIADSRMGVSGALAPAMAIPHAQRFVEEQQRVGSMARSEGDRPWSTF